LLSKLGKLRESFKKFIDSVVDTATTLLIPKEKLYEALEEFKLELISRDVAFEAAEDITNKIKELIEEKKIRDKKTLVKTLREIISSYFESAGRIDILELAKTRKPLK